MYSPGLTEGGGGGGGRRKGELLEPIETFTPSLLIPTHNAPAASLPKVCFYINLRSALTHAHTLALAAHSLAVHDTQYTATGGQRALLYIYISSLSLSLAELCVRLSNTVAQVTMLYTRASDTDRSHAGPQAGVPFSSVRACARARVCVCVSDGERYLTVEVSTCTDSAYR